MKKLLLIVNPRAGRTKSSGPLFEAVSIFSEAGYLVSVHKTTGPGDATRVVAERGSDFDVVVCSGGDGTLNETISGVMQMDIPVPVGYLPAGSTNDFAAGLRIPENPVAASHDIVESKGRRLDLGRFREKYFVYVASFGAFTKTAYAAPQNAKNALGHFAYILEGMKDLGSLRPYRVRVTADGEVLDGEWLFGAVCNSTSIGGLMKLSREEVVLDDGKFELLLVPSPKTPLELNDLLLALLSQQYDQGGLVFRHVSRVLLETEDEGLNWALDGEYVPGQAVTEIANLHQAVTMLL